MSIAAGTGWLMGAPRDLAAILWAGVGLGWWASLLASGLALVVMASVSGRKSPR